MAEPEAPWIDRVVSHLGARRLVAGRPGLGWMLVEFFPVAVWSRITGAINLENSFYLVGYLSLLGAERDDRATLMALFGLAVIGQALVVLVGRRHGGLADAKRRCVRTAWIARGAWLMAVFWPLVADWLGLPPRWGLYGLFAGACIGQFVFFISVSAWTTWTQRLVPEDQRGPFFAWRNISGFLATILATQAISLAWPAEGADGQPSGTIGMYALLFGGLTGAVLLTTLWLAKAPDAPDAQAERAPLPPLREAFRGAGVFWRYVAWNVLNSAALATTVLYVPDLIRAVGIDTAGYAFYDWALRHPAAMLGMFFAGAYLLRCGAAGMLVLMNLLIGLGLVGYLVAAETAWLWLVPVVMAIEGFGRAINGIAFMSRLYEVMPVGDQRFPAVFLGIGAVSVTATALAVPALLDGLEARWPATDPAWGLVAIGAVLRLLSIPLVWDRRRREAPGSLMRD